MNFGKRNEKIKKYYVPIFLNLVEKKIYRVLSLKRSYATTEKKHLLALVLPN